jgi:hypothetical protein
MNKAIFSAALALAIAITAGSFIGQVFGGIAAQLNEATSHHQPGE